MKKRDLLQIFDDELLDNELLLELRDAVLVPVGSARRRGHRPGTLRRRPRRRRDSERGLRGRRPRDCGGPALENEDAGELNSR